MKMGTCGSEFLTGLLCGPHRRLRPPVLVLGDLRDLQNDAPEYHVAQARPEQAHLAPVSQQPEPLPRLHF